jgi:bis(5'-nucleosidyl)-tetraphosphatase
MKFEKSCGAVVFRKEGSELLFLVIRHKNGGHWGFPKGHVEEEETEHETALREIQEETGLKVTLLEGFRSGMKYSPLPNVTKEVIFFVGKAEESDFKIQLSEVLECHWADYGDACKLLTHENSKKMLEEVLEFLLSSKMKEV